MEPIQIKLVQDPKECVDYVKLIIDALNPIAITVIGYLVIKATKRIEHSQWRNQKLIEKRIETWTNAGPCINDIFCYCMRIGAWKEMTPLQIIQMKRASDKSIHLARPYFSHDFLRKYQDFTKHCFAMYQGHGVDAKLKTALLEHKNGAKQWKNEWDLLFFDEATNETALRQSYDVLLDEFQKHIADPVAG